MPEQFINNSDQQEQEQIQNHDINSLTKRKDFITKTPMNKNYKIIAIAVIIGALFVGGAVYTIGKDKIVNKIKPLSEQAIKEKNEDTVQNPITGEIVPAKDAASWIQNRPIAVMINNHVDARPQSGLIYADLVYEVVAEGGITRYVAFFLDNIPEKVGPVRSTREYYLVLVKEIGDAMLMHEGWSPQALEAIETWPVRSLQRGGASAVANWRDNPRDVAVEHTLYTDLKKAFDYGEETLGWSGKKEITMWQFKDDAPAEERGNVGVEKPITIDFWYSGDYSSIWKYNPETNMYLRFVGYDVEGNPIPLMDQEQTDKQVQVKDLIVQFATESSIEGDAKNRLEYELIGSNSALVFMDGNVIQATWAKDSRDGRTLFYDTDGNEIQFNRGKIWVSIVPDRNMEQVTY